MSRRLDTQAIGLDAGAAVVRWLTGAENLHYGLWTGLDVTAANLGAAQGAYTDLLLSHLPPGPLRILDIGGGAGETAKRLITLGHQVEIVVPSGLLAARCRENAPGASVHECRFEDWPMQDAAFDLCLFSESFQYLAADRALNRCRRALRPGGTILIADCFRADRPKAGGRSHREVKRRVGGGHKLSRLRPLLAGFEILTERDITEAVAPSIDLEADLFRVLGQVLERIDAEIARARPGAHWLMHRALKAVLSHRRRARLADRLAGEGRNAEAFCRHNRYLILHLRPRG